MQWLILVVAFARWVCGVSRGIWDKVVGKPQMKFVVRLSEGSGLAVQMSICACSFPAAEGTYMGVSPFIGFG